MFVLLLLDEVAYIDVNYIRSIDCVVEFNDVLTDFLLNLPPTLPAVPACSVSSNCVFCLLVCLVIFFLIARHDVLGKSNCCK